MDERTATDEARVRVVALVPAFNRADSVGATVQALRRVGPVDRVVVVDDGSSDGTSDAALAAGAEVLQLPANRGKGGAVAAGVDACPEADVFLLVDADVGETASSAQRLLEPVLADEADLVVGVLPRRPGRNGGFGTVLRLASGGIRRTCGIQVTAPLSGQRAVRARHLRDLRSANRFGLEVAMTIDAVRSGARLREVEVAMDHRHTGRDLSGFWHRGRQALDVVAALWSRVTSARLRVAAVAMATLLAAGALIWSGGEQALASVPGGGDAERVVLVGVPHLGLDDLDPLRLPTLDRLAREGAMAATNVRTLSYRPSSVEAYATVGAGTRVGVSPTVGAEQAYAADEPHEGDTAAEVAARRSGGAPHGSVVLPAMSAVTADAGSRVLSAPGALGQRLADSGVATATVGNADIVDPGGRPVVQRPAALAAADRSGSVDAGTVDPDELLVADPTEPFGLRADVEAHVAATTEALRSAQMVTVDLGDTDRAAAYGRHSRPEVADAARRRALQRVDAYLARLVPQLDDDTLLLVVGVTPPGDDWSLTPTVAYGSGVVPGALHSTTTRRESLITLTDLAPTILDWLDLDVPLPEGMSGRSLRFRAEQPDLAGLRRLDDRARNQQRLYKPVALTFIWVQAVVYLLAIILLSQRAAARVAGPLRWAVLTFAAWPLATFLERALPGNEGSGPVRQGIVWLVAGAIALVAVRLRRGQHPLTPLAAIAGATVTVLVADVGTGAHLQMASILGYSPNTAGRYYGLGNTAFAVLAACAVVWAAVYVARAPRPTEALVAAGALLTVVLLADIWPTLGADVGGMLTLAPVFGLLLLALSGRRLSWRATGLLAAATVLLLGLVTGVDLLRPADERSHLGNFVAGIVGGGGDAGAIVERKWAANVRLLGVSFWTWLVPIIVAFLLYVLVFAKGWQRLLPKSSPVRIGVVATLAAGLLGWLVNDSGVVVSALVLVFVAPYLTLLALHHDHGQPRLLQPPPVL